MKRLNLEEWKEKYKIGDVKRFDQKNTMFNRPGWDREINSRLEDWSFMGDLRTTPGYRLEDQALRWGSSRGTMMTLFNTFKPIPSPASVAVMKGMDSSPQGGMRNLGYTPPEGVKIDTSDTKKVTQMVKKAARWFGADLVGVCKFDRRWAYSHIYAGQPYMGPGSKLTDGESRPQEIPDEFQYVVVMAFEMDYELMKYMPTYLANTATRMGYSQMAITNNYLSAFIRNLGFNTIDCSINDVALSVPMAMQAGLGDLARNGFLVTKPYGPRVRLNNVITDLPLEVDAPVDFGVTEFCSKCEICADKCPSGSIIHGDRTKEPHNVSNVGGVLKWPINAETCRMQWAKGNTPCALCITVCPYNKPHTLFHRFVRWCTDNLRWGDPLYIKADEWAGYGKPKKADDFWENWEPRRN